MKKVILGLFSFLLLSVGITSADGIYHNSQLGLISVVSGGNTIFTIQDKNVGATCTDVSQTCSWGCFFQYGNNYCFEYGNTYPVDNSSLNLSSYSPGTYNSNGNVMYNIDGVSNNNIWGSESDNLSDKQGPCPDGYYITSYDFYFNYLKGSYNLGGGYIDNDNNFPINNIFFLSFPNYRLSYNGNFEALSNSFYYWYNNSFNSSSARVFNPFLGGDSLNKSYGVPIRCQKIIPVDPDSTWIVLTGDEIEGPVLCNFTYGNGLAGSYTPDQTLTINGYSTLNGTTISPYFNISYVDEDNQTLTESYDKTNLILGGKFSKTYTGGENNFWVLTALGSSTIPDIIYTGTDFTGSSNISGNVFTNFVDNGFNVIGTNIPNFISYGFVLIILIILIRLIRKFKGAGKGRI